MSITGVIPLTENSGLIRRLESDPKRILRWSGTAVGDVSGGALQATMSVPTGLAAMFIAFSGEHNVADIDFFWQISVRSGVRVHGSGLKSVNTAGSSRSPEFAPKFCTVLAEPLIIVNCSVTNADTKTLTCSGYAYAWDLEDARNFPFRFLWPGVLG